MSTIAEEYNTYILFIPGCLYTYSGITRNMICPSPPPWYLIPPLSSPILFELQLAVFLFPEHTKLVPLFTTGICFNICWNALSPDVCFLLHRLQISAWLSLIREVFSDHQIEIYSPHPMCSAHLPCFIFFIILLTTWYFKFLLFMYIFKLW